MIIIANLKDLIVSGTARILNKVYASEFVGKLTGNADTATSATKLSTARTIALTGSVTGSGVFDGSGNLSIATTTNHTHSYLPLSGGTMTGVITAKPNSYDDSYSGSLNMNNSNIYGLNSIYTADVADGAAEGIHFYRDSTHVDTLWMANGNMYFVPNRALGTNTTAANSNIVLHTGNYKTYCTPANIGAAASSHTHNYAGSSSAGGSATSAVKLDSSAGSATQPVYFSGGKPVACSYTLGKSVPSNAVFTDTNTWRGIQNNLTSTSTTDSLSANQGKVLKGLVDGKADGAGISFSVVNGILTVTYDDGL